MADARHKRDADARRRPRPAILAGSLAAVATGVAVVAGLALQNPSSDLSALDTAAHSAAPTPTPSVTAGASGTLDRTYLSRSQGRRSVPRPKVVKPAKPSFTPPTLAEARKTAEKRWTTDDMNLWTAPDDSATLLDVIPAGTEVQWTGRTLQGRDEVIVKDAVRYITSGYLSSDKPIAAAAGLSDAPCPDGSVEDGLADDTIRLYHALCHAFPQVKDYLGWGPRTEHDTGHAIDVMVYDDKELGDAVAAWAQEHASELNLYDVIWYDRIWTPVRSSEGWRDYGDHGSATANHMDHVHIGTN